MIPKEELRSYVKSQKEELDFKDLGIKREQEIDGNISHIIIISGIRRSGKSTLMKQIMSKQKNQNYFNFEDPRVIDFDIRDFQRLNEIFQEENKSGKYFFDEIQNINEWERFIRQLHDNKAKIMITGSNASLLSKELGTKLTGRHLNYEVFPFSYNEFLEFNKKKSSKESFEDYLKKGGFPEFLKIKKNEYHRELYKNIINRDIVIRHNLRDSKIITELGIFLITNSGKEFSYNKLKNTFEMGSATTATEYVSYLEDSYILFTVPKFEFSYRKQIKNPKKIYSIDTGLSKSVSASFSQDKGKYLENAVFLYLRREYKDIFYFREKGECDFVVKERGKAILAIQVCYQLTSENMKRELNGLKEAMETLKIKNGFIITLNEEDTLDGIKIVSAWKWMTRQKASKKETVSIA